MNKAQELLKISKDVNSSVDISRAMEFIYDKCRQSAKKGNTCALVKLCDIKQYLETHGNVYDRVVRELTSQGFAVKYVDPTYGEPYFKLSWSFCGVK